MKKFIVTIGASAIGGKNPCFIIAEAGVNHNGKLALAKKLIDAAREAGADAVKFQTFKAKDLVTERADMAEYQKKNIGKSESQFQMLKKLELPYQDFPLLKKYCDARGIVFLSTAHTQDAAAFLEPFMPAYKIASGDLTNIPFLEYVAKKGKPIILSTGMGTLKEVKEAIRTIEKAGNKKITLLHCTTNYPCPLEEVNLRVMQTMRDTFPYPVGYSDHTEGILVPIMAAALGAKVIEKHFTLDKAMPGPDHKASLSPQELKAMVQAIRETEKALGSGIKMPSDAEKRIAKVARKSIVARVPIPRGTVITSDMLTIKRPGTGIPPKYLKTLIGKKTKRDIQKERLFTLKDI